MDLFDLLSALDEVAREDLADVFRAKADEALELAEHAFLPFTSEMLGAREAIFRTASDALRRVPAQGAPRSAQVRVPATAIPS